MFYAPRIEATDIRWDETKYEKFVDTIVNKPLPLNTDVVQFILWELSKGHYGGTRAFWRDQVYNYYQSHGADYGKDRVTRYVRKALAILCEKKKFICTKDNIKPSEVYLYP